ncbi:hypothetical protein FB45DRAFT_931763 [Roridomyces roridus]|uniref:Uncharacterized protein n=1 Tax=Roridomyces roridus TaxID=1738132 RepID=A0AAD7BEJ2_9AGAR|nr:hypothetical protein FB45DRAFT_931763 [Roridomyces roridus]
MGFLVLLTYRRWYRLFADVLQTPWVPFFFAPFIVPVVVFASTRKFSWILWFTYSTVDHQLPTPQAMHDRLLQLPAELYLLVGATDSLDAWMMLGPYILNIITLVLLTISLILRSVPWALRRMHHERDFTCRVLLCSAALITFSASLLGGCLSYHYFSAEYRIWPAEAQRVFWRSFHCSDARSQLLHILRFIWERNLRWKQQRILEFGNHGQELWRELWEAIGFCVGTWRALHLIHKLVMVVPIVMLYGHYYVVRRTRPLCPSCSSFTRCPKYGDSGTAGDSAADVDDSYIPTLGRESVSSNSWTASRSAQRNDKAQDTAREEHSRRDAAAMKIVGDAQLFFAISKPFYLQDILKRCFCSLACKLLSWSSSSCLDFLTSASRAWVVQFRPLADRRV